MKGLKAQLKNRFKLAQKIAIVGIGSELRADDIAGILIADYIKKSLPVSKKPERIRVFIAGSAPENLTGEIKRFNPTHVLIVDAADIGKSPGEALLFGPEEAGGFSFCTHRLPTRIFAQYLAQSIACDIAIIGVQPKNVDFGLTCSKEIEKSAGGISRTIIEALG